MTNAKTTKNIDPARLTELELGTSATATLTEALAINQVLLLQNTVPAVLPQLPAIERTISKKGIVARMQLIGAVLYAELSPAELRQLANHSSDTVRGWTCFAVAADPGNRKPEILLEQIHQAADDGHFAVREWSWLATRPLLVESLETSIGVLTEWAQNSSERLRRFASESLRPRGVWAKHINQLKENPNLGMPILEPLRSDESRYAQDSVSNWINDAAKSQPEWAHALGKRWLEESPTAATRRIIQRGLRSIVAG